MSSCRVLLSRPLVASSCRVLLIVGSFLALCVAARAGKYVQAETGGTYSISPNLGPPPQYGGIAFPAPYKMFSDGSYGGGGSSKGGSNIAVSASGSITNVFTWQPSYPGDSAPKSVIVSEQCTAKYSATVYGNGSTVNPPGACDDGMQDKAVLISTPTVDGNNKPTGGCGWSGVSTGSRYSIRGGDTFTLTINPSASVFVPAGPDGSATVNYTVTISPVIINLTGTTKDPTTGAPDLLTGQGVTATLSGANILNLPTASGYQWSVSGTVFSSFVVTTNTAGQSQGLGFKLGLIDAALHQPQCTFFTLKDEQITVDCTATALLPDQTTRQVQAEAKFTSFRPINIKWDVKNGSVRLGGGISGVGGAFGFYGTSPLILRGQDWRTYMSLPPQFQSTGGQGAWVQLVCPNGTGVSAGDSLHYGFANNDIWGLDNVFPYDGPFGVQSTPTGVGFVGRSGDSPQQGLISGFQSISRHDQMQAWLIFQPYSVGGQPVSWVPLQQYSWFWKGYASYINPNWDLSNADWGHVDPVDTTTFPEWNFLHPEGGLVLLPSR